MVICAVLLVNKEVVESNPRRRSDLNSRFVDTKRMQHSIVVQQSQTRASSLESTAILG